MKWPWSQEPHPAAPTAAECQDNSRRDALLSDALARLREVKERLVSLGVEAASLDLQTSTERNADVD